MRAFAAQIIRFVTHDMWRIPVENLTRGRAFALRQLRILYLAWRGFREDNLSLRASALTFYSVLSAVPVFAILFGIAKGFGFEESLQKQLLDEFPNHPQALTNLGLALYEMMDYREALKYYLKAIEVSPNDPVPAEQALFMA